MATTFVLVAGLCPAAQAQIPGLIYITASTGFDSNVYKSVRVDCPAGHRIMGGSFRLDGAEGAVVLDDFIPSPESLLVGAGEIVEPGTGNGGTSASWKLSATIACAGAQLDYAWALVQNTSAFASGDHHTATVRCPSGLKVVSGGASLANGWGHVSIDRLQYTGGDFNEVTARAVTDAGSGGFNDPWSVSAYAICAAVASTVTFSRDTTASAGLTKSDLSACPLDDNNWSVTAVGWAIDSASQNGTDRYVIGTEFGTTAIPPFGRAQAAATRNDSVPWKLAAQTVCATT
ncbi:hypothetical protein OG474_00685 [Kribbella sp. NBC_01505]|uniref:hypothetical protein n=1 Tax=Kribbella sp. NBC_01505 TaxID=2903580 RepID=UPI003869A668